MQALPEKQKSHEIFRSTASTVDIPTCWNPRAKQQPTGLIACGAMRRRPVRAPSIAPNHENPNLFSIGEGFGFFVFFGNENSGSSLTAVCPKPYQKNRITKVTTVRVP